MMDPKPFLAFFLMTALTAPGNAASAENGQEKGPVLLLNEFMPMRPAPSLGQAVSRSLSRAATMGTPAKPAPPATSAPAAKKVVPAAPHRAAVKTRVEGGGLVFLECDLAGTTIWIAVPSTTARPGDTVVFPESTAIAPYTSPSGKTFPSVSFPEKVTVVGADKSVE